MNNLTLGSLFDGSGGFPLAGAMHGVTPVWASEIEPYPIRVTKARFPQMKHLGNVLDVNGAEVEPVDIITFGSPCQDLSVAGKQAGLHKGERSSLFFEAIRIIKEMRNATNNIYPRIAVWENVPGAYSSNKGEDFRAVLQAFCSVKDEAADVPRPASGKWNPAGAIVGNGWSIAWRTFDAQFWGVPQRRKRIYLIADFGSERAGEVLFEQEGLPGDSAPGGTAGESTAGDAEGSAGRGGERIICSATQQANAERMNNLCPTITEAAGTSGNNGPWIVKENGVCYAAAFKYGNSAEARNIGYQEEISPTLQAGEGGNQKPVVCYPIDSHQQDSRFKVCADGISPTLPGQMGTGGNNDPMVLTYRKTAHPRNADEGQGWEPTDKADTLNVFDNSESRTPTAVVECYTAGNGQMNQPLLKEQARTLDCMHDQQIVLETTKPPRKYIIRRLTPLECCRLQGFPDWWCDGLVTDEPTDEDVAFWREVFETHRKILGKSSKPKTRKQIIKWLNNPHSDSAEYKMWGNGIALPNAEYVVGCAKRLIERTEVER